VVRFSLTSSGLCELVFLVGKANPERAPFYAHVAEFKLLNWIDRIRRETGFADQEYAIAATFIGRGQVVLEPYGDRTFSNPYAIPEEPHIYPTYPVGSRNSFHDLIARFHEDAWNSIHVDPAKLIFRLAE
jgi:hypothetical protein